MAKRIIYHPPSLPTIGKLVDQAFDQMEDQDPSLTNPEIRRGLAQFLAIAATILAKYLSTTENVEHTIDNDAK
jgi:hypothetical protein